MEIKSKALVEATQRLGVQIDHADAGANRGMLNPGGYEVEIVLNAPERKLFAASNTHSVVASVVLERGWTLKDAAEARAGVVRDALSDLADGLVDCDPETCESDCYEDSEG